MTHAENAPTAAEVAAERYPDTPSPLGNCAWFLECMNDAYRKRRHPIHGYVPVCERCDAHAEGSGIREA